MGGDEHDNVIDLGRFVEIGKRVKAEGREAVAADDLGYYDRCIELMAPLVERMLRGPAGREADHALGLQLIDALPDRLIEQWGELTPADLGLLARVLPDELPPDARRLVE